MLKKKRLVVGGAVLLLLVVGGSSATYYVHRHNAPPKQHSIKQLDSEVVKRKGVCPEGGLFVSYGRPHDKDKYGNTLDYSVIKKTDGDHARFALKLAKNGRICAGSILYVAHKDTYAGTAIVLDTFTKAGQWVDPLPQSAYGSARQLIVYTGAK
jgi:hypothetical protein